MYKVIVADDEPLMLEGWKTMIDWEAFGYQLCGAASDGDEALELIEQIKPDLLLTDIRMPGLSGLELIGELDKRNHLHMKSVIVSGYAEFDYARQAMQYGVDRYVLKPIMPDEIHDLLQELKAPLESLSTVELSNSVQNADIQSGILQLLHGQLHTSSQVEKVLGDIDHPLLSVLLTESSLIGEYSDFNPVRFVLGEIVSRMRADGISAWFFEDVQPHIGLLAGCSSESLLTYVTQVNNSFAGISTYTSGTVENHTALTSLYLELQQQLNHSVQSFQTVNKKSPIPTAQQIAASHALSTREQSIYTTTLTAAEFLLKQVKAGEAEAAEAAVNDLFYLFEEQEVPEGWSDSLIRHIEDELLQLLSYSPEHLSKLEHLENNTRQALILRCRSQAQQVADSLAGQSQASTNPVQAIVAYAKAHYRDKLQLRELADKLHINSVHLGQAFKRELGCCFNDYIHRLRAEEAQRMLRRTDMKIAEVAERLGYHDTEYFSAKFKAATGELPSAYRTRKQVASL